MIILLHPRFLKSSVVIDSFSQCYWLKQNWHVLTAGSQVTRGYRCESHTASIQPDGSAKASHKTSALDSFWEQRVRNTVLIFISMHWDPAHAHGRPCHAGVFSEYQEKFPGAPQFLQAQAAVACKAKALYYFFLLALRTMWEVACCMLCVTAHVSWAMVRGAADWGSLALSKLPTLKPGPRPTPKPCHP